MSVTSWIRRQFKDAVSVVDYIPGGLSSSAMSFVAHDGSSYPDGSIGNFIITVDQGFATEEKVLIASRSGATFTVAASGRGYGTGGATAQTHGANATILHTLDAQDLDEANQVAVQTLGAIQASGDLLVGASVNTLNRLARGSTTQFLQTIGTALQWTGFGAGESQPVGNSNADGSQTTPARSDHVHQGVTNFGPSGSPREGSVVPGNADYLAVSQPGISGANAATTRFVGATASGAPVISGFSLGDYIVDQSGTFWVCTAAPGTWRTLPMGTLGYAQITSNTGSIVSGTMADLPTNPLVAPAVTVPAGRRLKITVGLSIFSGSGLASDIYVAGIVEGSTILQQSAVLSDNGTTFSAIVQPTAGAHTYKVQAYHFSGAAGAVIVANATQPAYILVEDIGV